MAATMVVFPMVAIDWDYHVLLYITGDLHGVHIILFTTIAEDSLSIVRFIIIFKEESSMVHVVHIETDIGPIDLHEEIIILHEKLAIVINEVVGLAA